MAAIDPDIDELLSALLATPAAPIARAAIDSIVDEIPEELEDRLFTREADGIHFEFERQTRRGQLDLAHRIISGRIKREIRMLQRLRQLAPQLGLKSVSVLPPPGSRAELRRQPAELLDKNREEALDAFLTAWNDAQGELRQRWDASDGG